MEDLARNLYTRYDGAETLVQEDNISGGPCGIRGTFYSNTAIGFL